MGTHGIIKNFDDLVSRDGVCSACLEARRAALNILEEGVKAADPYGCVSSKIGVVGGKVNVCGHLYDADRIFVIGFGKAAGLMAKAVEDILGDRICDGVVSVPKSVAKLYKFKRIKVYGSGHPLPDEGSVKAASRAIEILSDAGERDLVIVLVSGGGSALFEKPADEITLEDLIETTELLLRSGATINEVNVVRKHMSMVKGGWLAKHAYPATVVSLIISDVVGDDLGTIASGPTAPDPSTYRDAYRILVKYGLWNKVPESVRDRISKGMRGEAPETIKPGDPVFRRVRNIIVASNIESLKAMEAYAKRLGYNTLIATSMIQGEAREVGKVVASIALSIRRFRIPIPEPAVVLFGGETTVTVRGHGRGGRNQELALAASMIIHGEHGIAIVSMGSDGIDGITDVAGGIVDGHSYGRALEQGLDIDRILEENDSYTFFKTLRDYIYTGPTGTNVNDFIVVVVGRSST